MTVQSSSPTSTTYHIGLLLVPIGAQLLDASPIDLFTMCTVGYLQACKLPTSITSLGLHIQIHIICSAQPGSLVPVTGNIEWKTNDSLETCPVDDLHVLLIPGPDSDYKISKEEGEFIRRFVGSEKAVALMSVCTGIFPLMQTGLLEGLSATAPRGILPLLRPVAGEVEWVEKRWVNCVRAAGEQGRVENGDTWKTKIWTSGGITNGLEMVAAFLREWLGGMGKGSLADVVLDLADVGARGQEYGPEVGALGKVVMINAQ